ncbi:MAG: S-layer homology domain-containing protein, partial [Oscillospiraceae bacterium]|nr:S-layer homology domain-containing protein [Oscillospiraceae bacterium]
FRGKWYLSGHGMPEMYVADYAQDAVKALISSGIVNGKNGKIAPTDYTTRAEVAVLLRRIIDYIA